MSDESPIELRVPRGKTTDDVMIELAASGKSMEEISRHFGGAITPLGVKARVDKILEAPDWLTDIQQERALLQLVRLNLLELRTLANDLITVDAYHDNAKIQLAYIDRIFDRYNKRKGATDEDLNTYNQNVGRHLGMVVDGVIAFLRGALRDQLKPAEWDQLISDAMQYARTQIEAKQKRELA